MASATLAVEIILHEIAPKGEEKEDSRHWKLGDLGRAATGRTRTCSVATRGIQVHSECRES